MADDQLRDLFGSDSDEDLRPQVAEPTADEPKSAAPERPEINVAKMREEQLKDLFGSDEEDDQPAAKPSVPEREPSAEEEEDDGLVIRESTPELQKGPPMTIEVALHDVLASDPLKLVKLSNIVGIEPRPFDAETFKPSTSQYIDERGQTRVHTRDLNAIRWRWVPGPDGTLNRQSNARFVKWSDGSTQLIIGNEPMDIREVDVSNEQNYLYVRHSNLIQGQPQLTKKMVFRPAGLGSAAQKRLREAVDARGVRQQRVKATATLVDPKQEQEKRIKAEDELIKSKETLVGKQQKAMRKYAKPQSRYSGPSMLNAAFLEEEDDDDYFRDDNAEEEGGDDDEEKTAGGAIQRIKAKKLKGSSRGEEDEEDAARRLNAAKSGAKPATQKGGVVAESDEDISEEDDDEMKDFIVDEEEEDDGRRLSELEELMDEEGDFEFNKRKKRAAAAAAAAAESDGEEGVKEPAPKKRAVVFDDDDDE